MVLNKNNIFLNQPTSYKTFFDNNTEYYDNKYKYKNKIFKLFDNDEGGNSSPYLKITQEMIPPTGYNGKLVKKILIADTNEDVSLKPQMKIRRVEIYENTDRVNRIEYANSLNRINQSLSISGGRKANPVKKEICGRLRCIYKISGSRKEHVKHKGSLITVVDYKKLMKNNR